MSRRKSLYQLITTIVFIGLLVSSALFSRQHSFQQSGNNSLQEASALKKYGFYLTPDNAEANITFRHTPPELDKKLNKIAPQIASMGAAVSVVDFDNDGWNDLYFTNSGTGSKNALYRNLHNGKFQDVAAEVGLADLNTKGTGSSMGAIWGDYDNDGFTDMLLYKWGQPELFHNINGKKFERVTDSGLPDWINTNSAIWFDFNNDGLLDLFIGGYYKPEFKLSELNTTKIMPESFRYANNGGRNYLLLNTGNGKFKDVTVEYGLTSTKWTLAAGAADFTGDGYPELYVADDYNVDEFYINQGGKKFVEMGKQAGVGFTPKSGMNTSFGDIGNDGMLGVYTTNITEKGILIQGNNYWQPQSDKMEQPKFVNLGQLSGIENAGWSYGAQFGDLNNDGYMDLYVANGFISGKKNTSYWYDYSKVTGGNSSIIGDADNWPDMQGKSQSGYEQNKIWLNNSDGLFEDVSDETCPPATYDSRSVVVADLWNRGVLDVVVANQNNVPLIYKNHVEGGNHWVDFDLHGTASNASAVGAKVVLEWNGKKQVQIVTGGIGFSSQNQHRLHFGIGKNTKVDRVTIYWPSGRVDHIENPGIDKLHLINEKK
ncbi:CRTAC1 family protein [Mucilaginibacter segetis]|uniref:CRTAC1 family protein n=1 Tax=Mucilaginibacter segetis TaxID=2793071 RepID=A0A934PSK3_9SPHI|nr:CRTAC1 family protein [Mucilaginibacter segetis]MBK0378431.1 CRTAC1 family protein [Mucilaginibacter segetis]